MSIDVLDMRTGEFTTYCLSPVEAVAAAYAQIERLDFNTWMYEKYESNVRIFQSGLLPYISVITLGNQSAICKVGMEYDELQPAKGVSK